LIDDVPKPRASKLAGGLRHIIDKVFSAASSGQALAGLSRCDTGSFLVVVT